MGLLDLIGLGRKARIYVVIYGDVYEGSYHIFVEKAVRSRSGKGWMRSVKRDFDSYIELEIESSQSRLEDLLLEIRVGPPGSRIKNIKAEWRPYTGQFNDFRIRN